MKKISIIQDIWSGFDFSYLLSIILAVVPSLLCITIHELSHGLVAYKLGDDTAKRAGRLTLNPIRHIDIMGLFMMIVFHVGWAKPVPVNMFRFKKPKQGMAITAFAGPISNLILAILFLLLYGVIYYPLHSLAWGGYLLQMLSLGAYISIGLAIFNCIPVPPLDGSKVLFSIIRDETYQKLMHYERYGSLIMLALVWTGAFGRPLSNAISFVFDFLWPIAQWSGKLGYNLFIR